jgi:hypothetical protein
VVATIEGIVMPLPNDGIGLVIRTDFSDPTAWEAVVEGVAAGFSTEHGGPGGGDPLVDVVDDEEFSGLTPEQAGLFAVDSVFRDAVFLADNTTMTTSDRTLLAVAGPDMEEAVWKFRMKPKYVQSFVMMCSTKLSFVDYLEDVDDNGMYRW